MKGITRNPHSSTVNSLHKVKLPVQTLALKSPQQVLLYSYETYFLRIDPDQLFWLNDVEPCISELFLLKR